MNISDFAGDAIKNNRRLVDLLILSDCSFRQKTAGSVASVDARFCRFIFVSKNHECLMVNSKTLFP
jgi:hypothetical protein